MLERIFPMKPDQSIIMKKKEVKGFMEGLSQ